MLLVVFSIIDMSRVKEDRFQLMKTATHIKLTTGSNSSYARKSHAEEPP